MENSIIFLFFETVPFLNMSQVAFLGNHSASPDFTNCKSNYIQKFTLVFVEFEKKFGYNSFYTKKLTKCPEWCPVSFLGGSKALHPSADEMLVTKKSCIKQVFAPKRLFWIRPNGYRAYFTNIHMYMCIYRSFLVVWKVFLSPFFPSRISKWSFDIQ